MGTFDTILFPLKWVVATLMVFFHNALGWLGMDMSSGAVWVISIILLTVVIRVALIPLFVKQIKASRGMQLVAPELQKIQAKYKGRKDQAAQEAMGRETMELYRKHGTNPLASCWPILLQSPIFFALFRVLNSLQPLAEGTYQDGARDSIGPLTQALAHEASQATFLGANITSTFMQEGATTATRIVTIFLVVLMSVTTFTTQKQLTQKNMPAAALQGPMAQQQKIMLYALPLIFAISGVNFPIGVLVYWSTTNLWSMGQQFYVIRRNPTPGSEAERRLKERQAAKAAKRGIVLEEEKAAPVVEEPRGQRQQPKRKDRAGAPRPQGTGQAKPTTRPAGQGKPAGQGRPAGAGGATAAGGPGKARPPASKAGGSKPAGSKPAGSKPAGAKPTGSKPAGSEPVPPKSAADEPTPTTDGTDGDAPSTTN